MVKAEALGVTPYDELMETLEGINGGNIIPPTPLTRKELRGFSEYPKIITDLTTKKLHTLKAKVAMKYAEADHAYREDKSQDLAKRKNELRAMYHIARDLFELNVRVVYGIRFDEDFKVSTGWSIWYQRSPNRKPFLVRKKPKQ